MRESILYIILFAFLFSCEDNVTPPPVHKIGADDLFVLESDFIDDINIDSLKIRRNIFVLNKTKENIELKVEAFISEEMFLKPPYSPTFGGNPYAYELFNKYFDIPRGSGNYIIGNPTSITENNYMWLTKLGTSNSGNISYSNFLGTKEKMFRKKYNTNNLFGLEIVSNFSIKKNKKNPFYFDIEIEQTLTNKNRNPLIAPFLIFFFPLNSTYSDYYNIIFEMIIYEGKYFAFDTRDIDGFGRMRRGKRYDFDKRKLLPGESIHFTIKEIIKPLRKSFFIHPLNFLIFDSVEDQKLWNGNSIKANGETYKGKVGYMKRCTVRIPTYILFSINDGEGKVIDYKEAEPTYP